MNKLKYVFFSIVFLTVGAYAQEQESTGKEQGHTNSNKFKQLYDEFSTPNLYRSASGAPGPNYYQQQADYKMDLVSLIHDSLTPLIMQIIFVMS